MVKEDNLLEAKVATGEENQAGNLEAAGGRTRVGVYERGSWCLDEQLLGCLATHQNPQAEGTDSSAITRGPTVDGGRAGAVFDRRGIHEVDGKLQALRGRWLSMDGRSGTGCSGGGAKKGTKVS